VPAERHLIRLAVAGLGVLLAPPAFGHVFLTSHEVRHARHQIKYPPCGVQASASSRGEAVSTFAPGQVITLTFDEYVHHPGYFRVSFDSDGDDDFVEPADYWDLYTNETVLLDGVFPHEQRQQGPYTLEVTLPEVECDRCTLQLTQIMTDKPPYVPATNDLYYNCIDLVLAPSPSPGALSIGSLLALMALKRRERGRHAATCRRWRSCCRPSARTRTSRSSEPVSSARSRPGHRADRATRA